MKSWPRGWDPTPLLHGGEARPRGGGATRSCERRRAFELFATYPPSLHSIEDFLCLTHLLPQHPSLPPPIQSNSQNTRAINFQNPRPPPPSSERDNHTRNGSSLSCFSFLAGRSDPSRSRREEPRIYRQINKESSRPEAQEVRTMPCHFFFFRIACCFTSVCSSHSFIIRRCDRFAPSFILIDR